MGKREIGSEKKTKCSVTKTNGARRSWAVVWHNKLGVVTLGRMDAEES